MCLIDPDTGAVRRVKARDWREWPLPGVMEVCVDRLWGLMYVDEARFGEWMLPPFARIIVWEDIMSGGSRDGYTVLLEDGSCRYMDVNGNMLGPTEGYWQDLYE